MMTLRFWTSALLMCAAAVMLHLRGDVDRVPPSRPLTEFPSSIDSRVATDYPLDDAVLSVLGHGFFLNRVYNTPVASGVRPVSMSITSQVPVGLFIGYFPTQRTGQSIHSPQNCLPGAGYSFLSSGTTDLTDPVSGKKYTVGEYLISDGRSNQEVLYWYRVHGRSVANDYAAKLYTLSDSIRYNRTDAALVRVITAVAPGEERLSAHERAVTFANQLVPILPAYVPD